MLLRGITLSFLLGTLTLAACTPNRTTVTPPATATPAIPQIPIVHSFDDLLKSPPITVGREQIHLGLESAACSANSGLLLYCIPDSGHTNFNQPDNIPWEERLGPVHVKIIYPHNTHLEAQDIVKRAQDYVGPILFIFAVCPRKPGPCEIQILAPDNTLLAHRQLQATAPLPSPWLTFNPSEIREKFDEGIPRNYALAATHAVPKYDGALPWPPTNPLPHFLPDSPDPTLTLSMNAGLITLNSQNWVEDDLLNQWLIRFWINGKPVTIQKTEPHKEPISEDTTGQVVEPTKIQFHLDLDPKLLNAKPNDRLEFQLLYCPTGLDYSVDQPEMVYAPSNHPGPRLTNKTKWNP